MDCDRKNGVQNLDNDLEKVALNKYPELKILDEKNGFVFCVRDDK